MEGKIFFQAFFAQFIAPEQVRVTGAAAGNGDGGNGDSGGNGNGGEGGLGGSGSLREQGDAEFLPIIGMENPWRYRNKAQFPFGTDKDGKIVTGFFAGRTHAIIPHEDCLLGVEENGEIFEDVEG